jgi:hypothetical protein
MTNEEKAERLEEIAKHYLRIGDDDAALLREAAQLMREQGNKSLLTVPDWKGMYEAQERDMAAVRQEREGLREKAELLEWALDHAVDYGSRTLEFVSGDQLQHFGNKYVIETPLRLKDPADFAELDCDEWNAQYLLAALRAARGAK